MTISDALIKARKLNPARAIRRPIWPAHIYAYHGMDNLLRYGHNDYEVSLSIASLIQDDWEIDYGHHYHGELNKD